MKTAKIVLWLIITIFTVTAGSFISVNIWSEKDEEITPAKKIVITPDMTVEKMISINSIPEEVIVKVLGPDIMKNPGVSVSEITEDSDKLGRNIEKAQALYEEHQTKNWFKIPLKFAVWFIFMGGVFFLLRGKSLSPGRRRLLYISGVVIFGIVLGADPSPMGTIKDAVALYGEKHVVFMPRMAALLVFLFTVFLGNKMICSWGCQFGVLQDFLFRINRDSRDRKGILPQYKIPFWITNSIRIMFFIVFTAAAVIWAYDIISPVDPFKIFKPQFMMLPGIIMMVLLLIGSLFIYRPWCHLFCPFGLAGWLVEKISWYKIKVDYKKCTACLACEKACPSTVMSAILRQDRVIPDCFSCGTCINACTFDALSFASGAREKPDKDHFSK